MTPTPEQPVAPRIAVILVSRNSADRLLKSLTALHGRGLFLIVVDCGWGDTVGLDDKFPGVRFIRLPRDFGMTKALNIGIRAADAEYVAFIEPAVEITIETLELLAATLEAEPATGAVCPLLVSPSGEPIDQVSQLPSPASAQPRMRSAQFGERVPYARVEAILFRSFFLRALRQIDERYGDYGPGIELCQQLLSAGKTILIHPTATAIFHPPAVDTSTAKDADRELGTSRFLSKHHGLWSGTSHLMGRISLAVITFRLNKAWLLMNQTKIDGN